MPSLHSRGKTVCDFCGEAPHKDKKECKAWGTKCDRCGRENHYAKVCKSKVVVAKTNLIQDEDAELFTLATMGAPVKREVGRPITKQTTTIPGLEDLLTGDEEDGAQDQGLLGAAGGPLGGGGDIWDTKPSVCGNPTSGLM